MGLLILSLVLGIVLACLIWLKIGNQLPVSGNQKWPMPINLLIYCLLCAGVIFILSFLLA
jgi:hypothetical protein